MFYELEFPGKYEPLWYDDDVKQFKPIICSKYSGHQRATRSVFNLSLIAKRKKIPDFCNTVYSDWILSDHVATILRKTEFTGYELRETYIRNNDTGKPFWELFVTGKGGEAHPDSGIFKIRECPYCGSTQYSAFTNGKGIIVDENNWDGSDFFTIIAYPKFVLVTERVKMMIEKYNWSGVKCIPSTEVIRPEWFGNEVSCR